MTVKSQRALTPLVASVITAIADRRYSRDERWWLDRIERRRKQLIESTDVIEYIDYGAGAPTSQRSASEMYVGVPGRQTVGNMTKIASKSRSWAGLLFRIVRESRPTLCLEMGAAAGISAAYQAAALDLNGAGSLITIEGGEAIARIAAATLKELGVEHRAGVVVGRFQDTLPDLITKRPFDLAFIDGHHDGAATCDYFDLILSRLSTPGIVILDDIRWSSGMQDAWHYASHHDGVGASFDLGAIGICVIESNDRPFHCTIAYD